MRCYRFGDAAPLIASTARGGQLEPRRSGAARARSGRRIGPLLLLGAAVLIAGCAPSGQAPNEQGPGEPGAQGMPSAQAPEGQGTVEARTNYAQVRYSSVTIGPPEAQEKSRWPERSVVASDLTGDGVRDLFVSSYAYDVGGLMDAGKVYLVSGGDQSVVYDLRSPQPQQGAQFGFYISVPGDVDGDGQDDLVVGASARDVDGNKDAGRVYVFSGATGDFLYAIDNPQPQPKAQFGARIGRAGDLTNDGVSEIIVGAPNNDVPTGCGVQKPVPSGCRVNQGQAFIFEGTNGDLVRTLNLPPADREEPKKCSAETRCGNFGDTVDSPGDLNGDGVPDQLVSAASYSALPNRHGRMYLFSGKNGELLARIQQPDPDPMAFFGLQDVAHGAPGDVNGDGVPDIYGSAFLQGKTGVGKAWVFDGKATVNKGRGVVLYEITDPTPLRGSGFGFSMSTMDHNQDGVPDLYIGQVPHHVEGSLELGGTYVFDGRDGSLLQELELPESFSLQAKGRPDNRGPALGWTSRAVGDLNGDGQPDYVGAAPFVDAGGFTNRGSLFFFLSDE